MSALSVDTDALRALADRMARTRDEVAGAARTVDSASSTAGGLVAGALSEFADHWHYGLKRLVDNLDACHTALHEAASEYAQVEHAIARAAGDG